MSKNIYRKILDEVASLPVRDPRPPPENVPKVDWLKSAMLKKRSFKKDAVSIYDVIASSVRGITVLQDKVPVDKLHNAMACHCAKLVGEAILHGHMPVNVMATDRFQAYIDFGRGRVMSLGVILHNPANLKERTRASFVVEESDMVDPWAEVFHFDMVEKFPFHPGEGTLQKREVK